MYVNQTLSGRSAATDRHRYLLAEELDRGAAGLLFSAQRLRKRALEALTCGEGRMPVGAANLMLLLALGRPMRIDELVETAGMPRPSVARHLRRLRDAGLVVGMRDGNDGRRRLIALSESGRAIGLRAATVWREMLAEAYLGAGPEGVAGARKVLAGLTERSRRG